MKQILLFGAGKSATFLIDYLKDLATTNHYKVTVADGDGESAQQKVGEHPLVKATGADAQNETERRNLIKEADVVISLLPPALHYLIAVDCIAFGKHLLTASYIDNKLLGLRTQIEAKKLLFLCEMGLDPGIDHMSAMEVVHRIKMLGGKITSFRSHCGGLVAPESDDNPWHYKISWNPGNIVAAGKAGAVFKENDEIKHLNYEELFASEKVVLIKDDLLLSYYPNRDSLGYMPLYHLEDANTFIRTTLRHPDFCFGWKNLVDLKLTDEATLYDTNNLSIADFFKMHFNKFGFNEWLNEMLTTRLSYAKGLMDNLVNLLEAEKGLEKMGSEGEETIMMVNENGELNTLEIEDIKGQAAARMAVKMHEASLVLKQLFFLGLDSDEKINKGNCTPAQVLQFILEKKLSLTGKDRDMVVMVHEIEYDTNGKHNKLVSNLIVKGEDSVNTAMAKTVGLPLGIAAKLILEGSLTVTGLHIPVLPAIYIPILEELKNHGIAFEEKAE